MIVRKGECDTEERSVQMRTGECVTEDRRVLY